MMKDQGSKKPAHGGLGEGDELVTGGNPCSEYFQRDFADIDNHSVIK
ncbi:hypothetical protein K1X45_15865 [Pseudochrobactrum sp. Wa41.01b-1]|nr:hypothetical protein [Pseudochrobactrum sp. Wa41.01b-1]QYM72884.1 hypothetical protein K1X45_15865 [Pseudochrobactrum sp. Wa41.01b-1]